MLNNIMLELTLKTVSGGWVGGGEVLKIKLNNFPDGCLKYKADRRAPTVQARVPCPITIPPK